MMRKNLPRKILLQWLLKRLLCWDCNLAMLESFIRQYHERFRSAKYNIHHAEEDVVTGDCTGDVPEDVANQLRLEAITIVTRTTVITDAIFDHDANTVDLAITPECSSAGITIAAALKKAFCEAKTPKGSTRKGNKPTDIDGVSPEVLSPSQWTPPAHIAPKNFKEIHTISRREILMRRMGMNPPRRRRRRVAV
ncbi:hypothetical protein GQ43DRAFT_431247 [Delitschia confertaspora ATCC 74209]|uniref:Uncharacterized protein n=1 Tax=Delitschia confertaspora ATCC 74209 TaxID=1513339 RepID=A0A9P4JLS4_9PLEO|nr:hypothetical protein GQ43DRAFT_431247 [Delitschia confertaspora ATCC 74209]